MWLLGAVAVGAVVVGAAIWAVVGRRPTNPADGLSVSQGWITSQRGTNDSTE